jgi:hypothetical protein
MSVSAAAPLTLRLYHGTSTEGWAAAQARGALTPRDHRALASAIASEYDLDPEALWAHPWFEYVRGSRSRDLHVFLTDDDSNARYYARCLNESTRDALKTAHRMGNDKLMRKLDRLSVAYGKGLWKTSETSFIAAWREAHAELQPLVLSFDFPVALLPVPEHVQARFPDPADWLQAVTRSGTVKLWEVAIPNAVSLDYFVKVELVEPTATAA